MKSNLFNETEREKKKPQPFLYVNINTKKSGLFSHQLPITEIIRAAICQRNESPSSNQENEPLRISSTSDVTLTHYKQCELNNKEITNIAELTARRIAEFIIENLGVNSNYHIGAADKRTSIPHVSQFYTIVEPEDIQKLCKNFEAYIDNNYALPAADQTSNLLIS